MEESSASGGGKGRNKRFWAKGEDKDLVEAFVRACSGSSLEVRPNCKNLYGVAFPHFYELMNIYGKDYATGKPAEDFVEAVNNLQKDDPAQFLLDSSDDDDDGCDGSDMNAHLSTMDNVMACIDDREQRADEREQKMVEKSEQVLEELLSLNLEGVTPSQIFQVVNILTAQPNKLMIFSKCPDASKGSYVKSLLGGSGDGEA
ncbi:hypothetical protein RDABS01_013744 [Bienertia sinuspersici]